MVKKLIKSLIPKRLLNIYHKLLAWSAAAFYGFPGKKMVVIGVTGTNGKSTICNFVAGIFESAGYKVGMTTTVNFRINGREWLNDKKMTMLGRTQLQRLLKNMLQEGCEVAVIEVSSEGLAQGRHLGIAFDVAVFTNLTPEHIESHGGFENYKKAKGLLFASLSKSVRKKLRGQAVQKTIVYNSADKYAEYFASFEADQKIPFDIHEAQKINCHDTYCDFVFLDTEFHLPMPGMFNVENALAAIQVAKSFGINTKDISIGLSKVSGVPGRMERIETGRPFTVIVDYAPEPASFARLYEAVEMMPHKRIIHVFGSCGGGRDRDRRPVLGEIAGRRASIAVITNEDPYDDDPMEIIREVAAGAKKAGKTEGVDLFIEPDRRVAIRKALELADSEDMVLVTGKGAEQAMCVADGKKIPWDDRKVVHEELLALK